MEEANIKSQDNGRPQRKHEHFQGPIVTIC